MAISDPAEFKRLLRQIERDLVAQAQFRALLTGADMTLKWHRQELRAVKARIIRRRRRRSRR